MSRQIRLQKGLMRWVVWEHAQTHFLPLADVGAQGKPKVARNIVQQSSQGLKSGAIKMSVDLQQLRHLSLNCPD